MYCDSIFDIDIEQLKKIFSCRIKEQPPRGLDGRNPPEIKEILAFFGSDVDEDYRDWFDPSDDIKILKGKALEQVQSYGHKQRCVIAMTVCDGEKTYLTDENLTLLSKGFDEIRSYAGQGYRRSALFEIREGENVGIIDHLGRFVAEAKYKSIKIFSVTHYKNGFTDVRDADLFSCELAHTDNVNNWEVRGADGEVIFSGLCYPPDVCEEKRRYKHFMPTQEVGGEYYEEEVESLYIYRSYSFDIETDPDFPENALEYAFRVSVFQLMLGNAEPEPDEQMDIKSFEYPRQQKRLTLKRGLTCLRA